MSKKTTFGEPEGTRIRRRNNLREHRSAGGRASVRDRVLTRGNAGVDQRVVDRAVEDACEELAVAAAHDRLARAEDVIGKADARPDVGLVAGRLLVCGMSGFTRLRTASVAARTHTADRR